MAHSLKAHAVPLSELALIVPGYSARPEERRKTGKYLLLGGRNIKDGHLITTDKDAFVGDIAKDSFRRAIAQPGDIIVSTLFDRRKLYIYRLEDPRAVVNSSCAIIRAPEKSDYIVSYLRTLKGKEQFLSDAAQATGGRFIPRLSIGSLAEIPIPLLPLSELQRLGDAHIQSARTDDLLGLSRDLEKKDSQIAELRKQLNALRGKDEQIESLRTQLTKVTTYYENRIRKVQAQISTNDLKNRITHGETSRLEFKSSLRWNLKAGRDDTNMALAVLRTIAAFCNTEGGELLIGVGDDHRILGIEHDHFENGDRFLLHLRNLITDKLIPSVVQYVTYELVSLEDKRLCRVLCKSSKDDIWLKPDKNTREIFYVRSGPSSTELPPRDALRYIRQHFQQ